MTLAQFITEFGITTYEMLSIRCDRMGVNAPSEDAFKDVVGTTVVSSPTEGVIVLDVFPVVEETTGDVVEPEETPKLRRRRKSESTIDE